MLKFLEQRAVALRSANFEKATKIEHEMTQFKDENFKMLTEPNTAYVTFKYESAYLKCLELYDAEGKPDGTNTAFSYKSEPLNIKRANQPTNLLWENFEM